MAKELVRCPWSLGVNDGYLAYHDEDTTIIYAHMQAVGMVNDHLISCFRQRQCGRLA